VSSKWFFRPKRSGDDISDPISGEFFADGSLENLATALVRESLQNALDAGKGQMRTGPVEVRIKLCRGSNGLEPENSQLWFRGLWHHVQARGNGLRSIPDISRRLDYLVIEDFGTSGLTGDTESDSADGERNNFVDFMRSDGRTRKSEGDRGSWGVGKNVFPRSSRINGFIAYSVRSSDRRRIVMGKSILKIRRVDGEQFQPSCYMGASWNPDEVPRPVESEEVIDQLRADFALARNGEPGLSLVIPWPDTEIEYADIRRAVLEQFNLAILAGALAVTLSDGNGDLRVDSDSIRGIVEQFLPGDLPTLELSAWALAVPDSQRLALAQPQFGSPKWRTEVVPDLVRDQIKATLASNERVAIRVPLFVALRGAVRTLTYFDIYAEYHFLDALLRPGFFREQLSISGVKRGMGVPKVRALVVVDDKHLANLLRAAEPPNHTDWDSKTANFRDAYEDGPSVINFVKSAVKQIFTLLRSGDDEPDPTVTIDFFAMPDPASAISPSPSGRNIKKEGEDSTSEFEPPIPAPRKFSISPVEGGFSIRPTKNGPVPEELKVIVAYDVLSGSPWSQFDPVDFDFNTAFDVNSGQDCEIEVLSANSFLILIVGEDFTTTVTGFDTNRDLIVRVFNPKESLDVDLSPELHQPN